MKKLENAGLAFLSVSFVSLISGMHGYRFHNRFPEGPELTADLSLIGTERESVIMDCEVKFPNGQKIPHIIHWDKKGEQVPVFISYEGYMPHFGPRYKGRVRLVDDKERLEKKVGKASIKISQLTEDDAGWYRCRVLFTNRPPASALSNGTLIHLAVFPRPEVLRFTVHPPQLIHVHYGETLILNCESEGEPKPSVQWYKEERMITPVGRFEMSKDRSELVISDVEESDIGKYSCAAENTKGKISHSFTVNVLTSATIVDPPRNIIVSEMQPLEWKCDAKAQPNNVTWLWLKNGAPITTLSMTNRASVSLKGSLVIHPLYAEDSGHYTCTVTNGIGMPQSASAYLNVEYPARVHSVPTVQYLPVGETGIIACPVEANPPAHKIVWTKNGHVFNPGLMPYKFDLLANGSLSINKVEERDEGHYRCQPYNALGSSGPSEYIQVFAVDPPEFQEIPEPIYRVMEGDSLTLPCRIKVTNDLDGDQVYIRWEKVSAKKEAENETSVKIDVHPEAEGGMNLKEASVSDSGVYTCVAVNQAAQKRASTKVVVSPWSPFRTIKEITATSHTVLIRVLQRRSLEHNSTADMVDGTQYIVWYRSSNDAHWQVPDTITTRAEDNVTVFSVGTFMPNTTYHLLLAVIQPKGWDGDRVHMQQYTILTSPQDEDPFSIQALMQQAPHGVGTSSHHLLTRDEQPVDFERVFAMILGKLEELHRIMSGKPYQICPLSPTAQSPMNFGSAITAGGMETSRIPPEQNPMMMTQVDFPQRDRFSPAETRSSVSATAASVATSAPTTGMTTEKPSTRGMPSVMSTEDVVRTNQNSTRVALTPPVSTASMHEHHVMTTRSVPAPTMDLGRSKQGDLKLQDFPTTESQP